MHPRVRTTLLLSLLGLSVALNVSLLLGLQRRAAAAPAAKGEAASDCLLDRLQLDTEQRRRLAAMRQRMHQRRARYWQRTAALRAELAAAICAPAPDAAGLDGLLERYAAEQAAMQRAVADHLVGVNGLLRPGQRQAFRALLRREMFSGIRKLSQAAGAAP
jgi:Zn-dependent oligopeptidase